MTQTNDTILRRRGTVVVCGALGALAIVGALAFAAFAGGPFPATYDRAFEQAAGQYLPMWDWRYLKAQCFQESRLNPTAVSPAGAVGLCQFMDATAREEWAALRLGAVDRRLAEPSILAAAHYDAKLRRGWKAPRPESDRRDLTFASYNAGAGSLQRAQKKCGGANLYSEILRCLPMVTGRFAAETTTYVSRINRYFAMML